MKFTEAVRLLREGKIIIHYDNGDINFLRDFIREAFPDDILPSGANVYYFLLPTFRRYLAWDCCKFIPLQDLPIIPLSQIEPKEINYGAIWRGDEEKSRAQHSVETMVNLYVTAEFYENVPGEYPHNKAETILQLIEKTYGEKAPEESIITTPKNTMLKNEVIYLPDTAKNEEKGVEFTHFLSGSDGWLEGGYEASDYDKIVYLGRCVADKDMFVGYSPSGTINIFKGGLNSGRY